MCPFIEVKMSCKMCPFNEIKMSCKMCPFHRVLTQAQCKWILYESCHKFFMKATQILYAFCFCSTLGGRIKQLCQNVLNLVSIIYIYLFFTLKDSSLFSVNLDSAGCFRI